MGASTSVVQQQRQYFIQKQQTIQENIPQLTKLGFRRDDLRVLLQVFMEIDENGIGTITCTDILRFIKIKDTKKIYKKLFHLLSENSAHALDILEFIYMMWNFCSLKSTSLASFVFHLYDTDNSNKVTKEQIFLMLCDMYGDELDLHPKGKLLAQTIDEFAFSYVTKEEFVILCSTRLQLLLFSVQMLQIKLQNYIGGDDMWERLANKRTKLFGSNYTSVCKLLNIISFGSSSSLVNGTTLKAENTTCGPSQQSSPFDTTNRTSAASDTRVPTSQVDHLSNPNRIVSEMTTLTVGVMTSIHEDTPSKRYSLQRIKTEEQETLQRICSSKSQQFENSVLQAANSVKAIECKSPLANSVRSVNCAHVVSFEAVPSNKTFPRVSPEAAVTIERRHTLTILDEANIESSLCYSPTVGDSIRTMQPFESSEPAQTLDVVCPNTEMDMNSDIESMKVNASSRKSVLSSTGTIKISSEIAKPQTKLTRLRKDQSLMLRIHSFGLNIKSVISKPKISP